MRFLLGVFLFSLAASFPAFAQDDDEQALSTDLIHSDVPLWGYEDDGVWPRHVSDDDGFGCANRIAMGDWRESRGDGDDNPKWKRFENYGVYHCFTMISHAYKRADLNNDLKMGFFIRIGTIKVSGVNKELWVTQEGGRPGSDYMLLLRIPDEGLIKKFDVLQVICPRGSQRKGPELDTLMTRYCAINSKKDLKNLARRMAVLPPYATITFDSETVDDGKKSE
jgi:hypothetical protein